MAERVNLVELQSAVEKAAAQVLHGKPAWHGPIILGFVAPEGIAAKDAQAIADKVAAGTGLKAQPTVVGEGAAAAGAKKEAALPHRPIIIGIIIDPHAQK